VPAGSGAEGTITVNPVNGYQSPSGGITLYCASITPLVTIAPYCSFSPTGSALTPSDNKPQSSTLTISTFGPVTTGAIVHPRTFYAFWLSLPMLALSGIGAKFGGKGSRTVWGMLGILLLSGSLLLLPACSNATTTTTTPNGITPANTYTFTIVGVDANGVASSNSGTSSGGPTVSLTVTAPKT